MKLLFVAAEGAPFSKTGGLGRRYWRSSQILSEKWS